VENKEKNMERKSSRRETRKRMGQNEDYEVNKDERIGEGRGREGNEE
jgi:hypothetical protein